MNSVIDLSQVKERHEVAPQSESTALVAVIERAARDPSIDIDKMERLLAMQERIFARNAKADFNAAMAACQAEMPRIYPRSKNDQTNSFYAGLDEIDVIARPIYTRHGFALSFGTADCPIEGCYRQTCEVSHRGGHSEMRQADLPSDMVGIKGNPNKTGVQGFGSTMTYGQRYITKLVFNIVIGGEDNDGNGPTLDAEQMKAIRARMKDSGTNESQFLEFWRVPSLDKMPAFNYAVIMDMLDRKAKKIDPRGDTSNVDTKLRDEHCKAIEDILNADKEEKDIAQMLRDHVREHLDPFPELWISVNDELARRGVCTKAGLKKWLSLGLEAGRYR